MPEVDYDYDPKDALATTDDSQETDHSVGAPQSSSYLQNRERNPGQQHENDITNQDNLAKRENTANSASAADNAGADAQSNPLNYSSGRGGRSSFFGNARSKIKAKVAKKAVSAVLAIVLGLGGLGLGVAAPSLLAGKIESVLEQRFIAPISKVVNAHSKNLWLCKLSSKCATKINKQTNASGENGDGLGQISDNAKSSIKANGGDITEPSGGSDGKIKLSNGDEVGTGTNDTKNMDNLSAADENSFRTTSPSANPDVSATGGEPTAAMLEEGGAAKEDPLAKDVGDDKNGNAKTIEEQLDDQKNGNSSSTDLTTGEAETVTQSDSVGFAKSSSGSSDEESKKSSSSGFEAPSSSIDVESSGSIKTRASEKIKELGDKIKSSGANAAIAALNVACNVTSGTSDVVKAYNLGVKLYKIQHLIRFAFTFLTVFDSIKADDGSGRAGHNGPTAEQFTQVMNQLTTVMKDNNGTGKITTKSGTDSFGYQVANGDLTSTSGKFNLTDSSKSASVGMPSKFTSTVLADSNTGDSNLFTEMMGLVTGGSSYVSTLISKGCTGIVDTLTLASAAAGAGTLVSFLTGGGAIADAISALGNILTGIATATKNNTVSEVAAWTTAVGYCGDTGFSGGLSIAKCGLSLLATGIITNADKIMGWVIGNLENNFLVNPMPVGADAMDAIVSGTGASMGMNAGLNAVPVAASTSTSSGATSYLKLESQRLAYNKEEDAVSRATDSPFDIYNNATFLGSIMGNFVASLYSNGNSPLGFAQSLLGMFGSSMSGILKGSSAYADNASLAYASSCTDSDIQSASIAADPFCNPIYGLDNSDTLSLSDTVDRITAAGWGDCVDSNGKATSDTNESDCKNNSNTWYSAIDSSAPNYDKTYGLNTDAVIPGISSGFGGSKTIGDFLDECVTRNKSSQFTPMGTTDSGSGMNNGQDCALTNSSAYGRDNLVTLYNYAEYFLANSNINQGSQLGSQADGSASGN